MAKIKKAVFISGYDGIETALSIIYNIKNKNTDIDLYMYDVSLLPSFLTKHFANLIEIPQTFYTRVYSNNFQKLKDKINFLKLFLKSKLIKNKDKKYTELHFLGYLNNPSFLIYEILFQNINSSTFFYKVPNRDYHKENKIKYDWKLWVLEKLFSRKFKYYDYPPQKVAIGLSEKELVNVKTYSWKKLAKLFNITRKTLNIEQCEKKNLLVLGTHFGDMLNEVDLWPTKQNISNALINEFSNYTIYYKPHYRSDFDLSIPKMKILEKNIPAEFIIPYFNVICGFDSVVFKSCNPGTEMVSLLKLIDYKEGDFRKDLEILKNNIGHSNIELIRFL